MRETSLGRHQMQQTVGHAFHPIYLNWLFQSQVLCAERQHEKQHDIDVWIEIWITFVMNIDFAIEYILEFAIH